VKRKSPGSRRRCANGMATSSRMIHELQRHNAAVERGEAVTIEEKAEKRAIARDAKALTDEQRDAVIGSDAGRAIEESQDDEFSADEVTRYFGGGSQPNEEGEQIAWQETEQV
jgi:hypothetical protein